MKRTQLEDQKEQLCNKDTKLERVMAILKEELPGKQFVKISKRVKDEIGE